MALEPLNCVYRPTNTDLISILNRKLQNKPIAFDQVVHLDLYSNNPSTLLQYVTPVIKRTKEYVNYTPLYRYEGGSSEFNRRVLGGKIGMWKQVSNFRRICEIDGSVSGKETRFVFYQGDVDVGVLRKTDWCMKEFTTMNEDQGGFAICKLREEVRRALDDTSNDDEEENDVEDEDDSDDDSHEEEYLIYTPRYRFGGSSEIDRRVSDGKSGMWKQVSDGKEMRFVFYEGDVDVGNVRKTVWCMKEFTTMNEDQDRFAICKVREEAAQALDDISSDDEEEDDSEDDSDDSDEE